MLLIEETPIPDAVLPVAQLKEHLRLSSGFADDADQDDLLLRHLRAAIAMIEARLGRILIERDFTCTLTAWRDPVRQVLPVQPVNAIIHVTQISRDGVETPADPATWQLIPGARSQIVARGGLLPMVPHLGAVRLGLMAGFGPEWSDLPADLAQACLMLAASLYDDRFDHASGHLLPASVQALIAPHRDLRMGARR
jgi:uncharacterized phiE125 gp8 family phage protein